MDDRPGLTAFEGLAAGYAVHRPTYPSAVFEAILAGLPAAPRAADIGCGTGISTRLLRAAGATVVGIDPSADMLRQASGEGEAGIRWARGTAEQTGLPSASQDLVVAAQAFHWFDAPRALAEFHRILAPNGRVALVWNLRQSGDPFTDEYNRIVVSASVRLDPSTRAGREALDTHLLESPLFRGHRTIRVDNPQELDEERAVGRAASASYFPKSEPERSKRIGELRAAVRRYGKNGLVQLSQVTQATIATRC